MQIYYHRPNYIKLRIGNSRMTERTLSFDVTRVIFHSNSFTAISSRLEQQKSLGHTKNMAQRYLVSQTVVATISTDQIHRCRYISQSYTKHAVRQRLTPYPNNPLTPTISWQTKNNNAELLSQDNYPHTDLNKINPLYR